MRLLQPPQVDREELFALLDADNSWDLSIEETMNNALKLLEMQVKSSVAKLGLTAHGVSRRIERMEKRALEALATRSDAEELSSPGPKPPGGGGGRRRRRTRLAAPAAFGGSPAIPSAPPPHFAPPPLLGGSPSALAQPTAGPRPPLRRGLEDWERSLATHEGSTTAAQEGHLSAPPPAREGAAAEAARWLRDAVGEDPSGSGPTSAAEPPARGLSEAAWRVLLYVASTWEAGLPMPEFTPQPPEGAGQWALDEMWRRELSMTEDSLRILAEEFSE